MAAGQRLHDLGHLVCDNANCEAYGERIDP
jgi:hypothetical protein